MSRNSSASKIKLECFDDLFGVDASADELKMVALSELYTFKNHPFKVLDDEQMNDLVDSIREHGVLSPAIARVRATGGYELISGHRRKHASELAGLSEMPVLVREYTDDEATIIMVDSNVQRENILPSEKARAYSLKHEAIKHRGKKGQKRTLEALGESSGESNKTVQRYIWLARLTDDLLELVDAKKLGFTQGVDISFLPENEQRLVYDYICDNQVNVSIRESGLIKELSQKGNLTYQTLHSVFEKKKPCRKAITLKARNISKYFADDVTNEEIEDIIIQLLDEWNIKRGVVNE